jgi:dUTP pyrophosphatase
MKVEFKKLYIDVILPKKANPSDAGFDLYARTVSYLDDCDCWKEIPQYPGDTYNVPVGERLLIKCGFAMALPVGFEAQVRSRSGLALKHGVAVLNSPGTIDAGYRNEVGVVLVNHGNKPFAFKVGDRVAQMVIQKLPDIEVVEVEELSNALERGMGGFGSTGI